MVADGLSNVRRLEKVVAGSLRRAIERWELLALILGVDGSKGKVRCAAAVAIIHSLELDLRISLIAGHHIHSISVIVVGTVEAIGAMRTSHAAMMCI